MVTDQPQYGQLFWWRESPQIHTLITLWAYPLSVIDPAENFLFTFDLFDVKGKWQTTWQHLLAAYDCLFLDSAKCEAIEGLDLTEGVLHLRVTKQAKNQTSIMVPSLYSILDWYSDDGEIVSLHNDQIIQPNQKPLEWTEIVVWETPTAHNSLVVLNGPDSQPVNSISLEIKNHLGETCSAVYSSDISPFSLHRLQLLELFPQILHFSQDQPITVSGTFTSLNVFIRPYVVTEGEYLSAYHGGNKYLWTGLPAISYKFMGRGEVNPMLAIHQDNLTTVINLLNTHGTLEQDFWIDANLYDTNGNLVASKEKWQVTNRNKLCQVEISDLLPDCDVPFVGHIALRFSNDNHPEYPLRLQALMEYRTSLSSAKVMAWSDIWNCRERTQFSPSITYTAYYRVWCKFPLASYISLTNCGINDDYDLTATYRLRLENGRGGYLMCDGIIAPQGTMYRSVHDLFPTASEFLDDQSVALLVVETSADLASMHLTQHQRSGVYAAEHFLPTCAMHEGEIYHFCGS